VQGSDTNFYGTTLQDGAGGKGTVFRISPSGTYTNLHSFSGDDGALPRGGLVQGSDGNFYGVTYSGGTGDCSAGCGTIFRITPTGNFTNLHSFNRTEGAHPRDSLAQASDGNFYGTTVQGGTSANCGTVGCGTVFRITPAGDLTTLHSFGGTNDGSTPYGGLVQGNDGNLYGTTQFGGASYSGTVFTLNQSGDFTNLYSFGGGDGAAPIAKLVQGSDGNFYGTASHGGPFSNGTVFQITPSGSLKNLYSFNGTDGANPLGLVQGSDGDFYGTTANGGANGKGTVFRISVPLNPPANQINAVQPAGNDLALSIPSVAGETYQLQFTTDLSSGNWSNVPGACVSNSIGAVLTVTNFGGALPPQGFYRFDITP
jgi:uncharacterized repeat protein (TIGR03803 family)